MRQIETSSPKQLMTLSWSNAKAAATHGIFLHAQWHNLLSDVAGTGKQLVARVAMGKFPGKGGLFDFWNRSYLGSEIWGGQNYLGSEISRSQMCYLWYEFWDKRGYFGSDISSMSLTKPFS